MSAARAAARINPSLSASLNFSADGELETLADLQRQAYEVLLGGGVAQALDLLLEDKRVVDRYDTARYAPDKNQWNRVSSRGRIQSVIPMTMRWPLLSRT